ncbi:hypothetical protein PP935_gp191 [Rhizobium phage RHph_N34]|uniref:Uncharacterized protein n=1 Tax=Rhizobium phage RHph_N34 TaxID=2509586 RepID=A0A7S5REC9_9CAUD|nr:hypothetical protein PP935_gp191 [Rhizobium phage RHph_N34]QIG73966.1 hypothetical protein EVC06_191 [Rhizobium phage RHph_N34]
MARSKREFVEDFILSYLGRPGSNLDYQWKQRIIGEALSAWDAMEQTDGLNEKASAKAVMG